MTEEQIVIADEQAETVEDQEIKTIEDAAEALNDDTEDAGNQDDEAEELDSEQSEADDDADPEDEETHFELADGETISLSEIRALQEGGMRNEDYTQKTQTLAEQREALETEQAAFKERVTDIETTAQSVFDYVLGALNNPPSVNDFGTTEDFLLAKENHDRAIQEFQQHIAGNVQQLKQKMQAHQTAQVEQFNQQQETLLVKAKPELKDPVKRKAFDAKIRETATALGYSPDEVEAALSGGVDHRRLIELEYAARGMASINAQKSAAKRVQKPKKAKAPKQVAQAPDQHLKKTFDRLKETGTIEDAVRYLSQ